MCNSEQQDMIEINEAWNNREKYDKPKNHSLKDIILNSSKEEINNLIYNDVLNRPYLGLSNIPNYSTDLVWALKVADKFSKWEIDSPNKECKTDLGVYWCVIQDNKFKRYVASDKSLPKAICKAVLLAHYKLHR